MNRSRYLLLLLLLVSFTWCHAQAPSSKPVFVIVHGAWGGGWAFKKVDSLLREKGVIVYRPTLTGQGERVHLASTSVGLQTHITDVVNLVLYENLQDVILVGHSYGGMVITGVADSVGSRIRKLVYLDALFPYTGESLASIQNATDRFSAVKGGFIPPTWVKPNTPPPHDVPHQLKTFTDTLWMKHGSSNLPTTYILTVNPGADPAKDDFAHQAERARKKPGVKVLQLEADHNPQWSAIQPLVDMLYEEK